MAAPVAASAAPASAVPVAAPAGPEPGWGNNRARAGTRRTDKVETPFINAPLSSNTPGLRFQNPKSPNIARPPPKRRDARAWTE